MMDLVFQLLSLLGYALLGLLLSAAALAGLYYYYCYLPHFGTRTDITTSSCRYDMEKYGHIIKWDKHCLYIHGKPKIIVSGEFHYWRVPDRDQWEPILRKYASAGLNCIRIYFHWGFHSPAQGVYHFDGNRDVEYLLSLCEEIGLYVLAAPGPYICAETQAGGIPVWVVAQRDVRIRHAVTHFLRRFDSKYALYCEEWFSHLLPILRRHQITENNDGCVIGMQIENEMFERLGPLTVGIHDDMRVLAKSARDLMMTVPFFTNDAFEGGSWLVKKDDATVWGKKVFGLDLFGFDKYVVFVPASAPSSQLKKPKKLKYEDWGDWDTKDVVQSLDGMEQTVRGFGFSAAETPIFIAELQGGWFNHYKLQHTYDHIYRFYGENYTRTIFDTVVAQGCTVMNYYMFFGGTNWGTLGDPDVYTSYDYSAGLREYGFVSGRLRKLRLGALFARSFSEHLSRTDLSQSLDVLCNDEGVVNRQRQSVTGARFVFLRNFNVQRKTNFTLRVKLPSDDRKAERVELEIPAHLPYKQAFIALGNYKPVSGPKLLFSSTPIHVRTMLRVKEVNGMERERELWVVQSDDEILGSMVFLDPAIAVAGNLLAKVEKKEEAGATIVSFARSTGWAVISSPSAGNLYILALDKSQLYTLSAVASPEAHVDDEHFSLSWGPYAALWLSPESVQVDYREDERDVFLLSAAHLVHYDPETWMASSDTFPAALVHHQHLPKRSPPVLHLKDESMRAEFSKWEVRQPNWSEYRFVPLASSLSISPKVMNFSPKETALDLCFTSGHIIYKCDLVLQSSQAQFWEKLEPKSLILRINARHRATVIVNGQIVGGHLTYSHQLLRPGGKMGPDVSFLGSQEYDISPYIKYGTSITSTVTAQQILILAENFGLNRQVFILDDARSPRGLLKASLRSNSIAKIGNASWWVAGVDVRQLPNAYCSSGLPDEDSNQGWTLLDPVADELPVSRCHGLQWFRSSFSLPETSEIELPLRLRLRGSPTAFVWINGILMARYYGNGDGPQRDFVVCAPLKAGANDVKILAYTWDDGYLDVSIRPWLVEADGGDWSGNLLSEEAKSHGIPFWTAKVNVNL